VTTRDHATAGPELSGGPLAGVRILALEQMQALPYATQLLARLGAEVVKVEHPRSGDLGRGSLPAMPGPDGVPMGATFVRNNLGKRSITIDLGTDAGRDLILALAPHFDVVCENFKAGSLAGKGLGYADVAAVHPAVVYLSVSGFGNTTESPYGAWPAYAAVAEAMSGLYEWKRAGDDPPVVSPVGALGDIGTALFGVIGVLAALRERDATGVGQYVDVAMFDSMVSFADVVVNWWSMGERPDPAQGLSMILDGFRAADGWFVVQVGREHEFARLAELVGEPGWTGDDRFATRVGWRQHIEVIRHAVNRWAASMTNIEACHAMAAAGIAAGPVLSAPQVLADTHLAQRNMLITVERPDGNDPVVVPGNPIKLSGLTEQPQSPPPMLGQHTDEVLAAELGLDAAALAELRTAGVIR
jgi:crotonobetainyl-CoA:carnitine CoA-transferase CaiB-like acyl-CoA transferase